MPDTTLHCRAADDGRYIEGIAVPWDQEIRYRGHPESFAPGSVQVGERVPLRYGHGAEPIPIGVVERAVDTDKGLWVSVRMLDGPIASQAWAAADAGLVRGFSIEFQGGHRPGMPVGQGRIKQGRMIGLALTENPAYKGALVTNARARTPRLDQWYRWRNSRSANVPSSQSQDRRSG